MQPTNAKLAHNVCKHNSNTGGREEDPAEATPEGLDPAPQALQVRRVPGQLLQALAPGRVSPRAADAQHDGRSRRGGRGRPSLQASLCVCFVFYFIFGISRGYLLLPFRAFSLCG